MRSQSITVASMEVADLHVLTLSNWHCISHQGMETGIARGSSSDCSPSGRLRFQDPSVYIRFDLLYKPEDSDSMDLNARKHQMLQWYTVTVVAFESCIPPPSSSPKLSATDSDTAHLMMRVQQTSNL
jgi:hypothetical protein